MAELRARVTQATFDRLRAMAEKNGVNLTAMISILINQADDPTPQIADNQRTDSGVVTKVNDANHSADSGGSGTTSGQIAESKGGIGGNGSFSNQPEEKTTQPPPPAKKPREPKEDPILEAHLETLRGIFPAGYKGDVNACRRHGRRVQESEWPDVFTGAKRHVDLTPRADLKFAEADVFLRKQLWGRYLGPQAIVGAPVLTSNPHPTDHRDWCRVDRKLGKTSADYREQTLEWMKHRSFELSGDYGSCAL